MSEKKPKVCLSELILTAVCHLQQKNGVSAGEIIEYVAKKRCCKPNQIESTICIILCKAKKHGILSESKGLYRIHEKYDDIKKQKDTSPVSLTDSEDEDEDDECDDDEDECDIDVNEDEKRKEKDNDKQKDKQKDKQRDKQKDKQKEKEKEKEKNDSVDPCDCLDLTDESLEDNSLSKKRRFA